MALKNKEALRAVKCGKKAFGLSRNTSDFTMSAPSSAPQTAVVPAAPPSASQQEILPAPQTLLQAAKLAIQQDKSIQMDYYVETDLGRAFLGEDTENSEKMLVKSGEEFTSLIQKIYKVQTDYIVITENSIYIVSGKIQKRKIKGPALRGVTE